MPSQPICASLSAHSRRRGSASAPSSVRSKKFSVLRTNRTKSVHPGRDSTRMTGDGKRNGAMEFGRPLLTDSFRNEIVYM